MRLARYGRKLSLLELGLVSYFLMISNEVRRHGWVFVPCSIGSNGVSQWNTEKRRLAAEPLIR